MSGAVVGLDLGWEAELGRHYRLHQLFRRDSLHRIEWQEPQVDQVIKDNPNRIHISLLAILLAVEKLWAGKECRPHYGKSPYRLRVAVGDPTQTKITDLPDSIMPNDIGWLDISVDDLAPMEELETT